MSQPSDPPNTSAGYDASGAIPQNGVRYSLKEMIEEVAMERRESVFGRELVDSTEIDKMFSKQRKRKKKK